ncbi:MAG: hypothetical protein OEZ22_14645 [Spirochaetia bacterium]|nr:hypothetical protein [Spirochaetia bacterium]
MIPPFNIPLSKEEFSDSIQKGLGRTYIHVDKFGDNLIKDILLNACFNDFTYDQQAEDLRSSWLYSIIKITKNKNYYTDAILNELENLNFSEENRAFEQLIGLAKELAIDNFSEAKHIIYKTFEYALKNEEIFLCEDYIVELDGIKGFLIAAETIGKHLYLNSSIEKDSSLFNYAIEYFDKNILLNELRVKSIDNIYIKYYSENCTEIYEKYTPLPKQHYIEKLRKKLTLDKIVNDVFSGKGDFAGHYQRFGTIATQEELNIIYNYILKETKTPQLIRFLWVFRNTALPELHEYIFDLALSKNKEISDAALTCLSNSKDPSINEFFIDVIQNKKIPILHESLCLLKLNYNSGNYTIIESVLRDLSSDINSHQLHDLGYDLLDIVKENHINELKNIVLWVYYNSPCTNCRFESIKLLKKIDSIPSYILSEGLYDCSDEIQNYIKNI